MTARLPFGNLYLPTRPMVTINIQPDNTAKNGLLNVLQERLANLPDDAIVKVVISGEVRGNQLDLLRAQSIRTLAKPSMNISTSWSHI